MSGKPTGEREFTELVTYHVFGNENWSMDLSIVNSEGVSNEFWNDRTVASPSLDNGLLAALGELVGLFDELIIHIRTLLETSSHTSERLEGKN